MIDAIESTRDFAPSDVRSASTASRSYFREQRVRDKLEPQLSLEHRVRDKSTYGLSANRPASPKQALFKESSPQDSVYLESIRTAFLLRVGGLNASGSPLGLHFMTFLAPASPELRAGVGERGRGSEKEGMGRRKRARVGEREQGP